MKKLLSVAILGVAMGSVAQAEIGEAAFRSEVLAVAGNRAAAHADVPVYVRLVPTAAGCSNAGDETARPVYSTVNGQTVFLGYECAQDNRGGGNGG